MCNSCFGSFRSIEVQRLAGGCRWLDRQFQISNFRFQIRALESEI
jgi:hypothetical protein